MANRTRIPSALEPYLRLPPETSLILLTGTLGCSVNWLTARFASGIINQQLNGNAAGVEPAIVLVSCTRDLSFWRTELKRTAGLDISRFTTPATVDDDRFKFVNCFDALSTQTNDILATIQTSISTAVIECQRTNHRPVLLIWDNPDTLLATGAATAQQLNAVLLQLRSTVHAAAISCSADAPLLSAATSSSVAESSHTPLETELAAFLTAQAHMSSLIMSTRELDTGAARDVSGVLRITRGAGVWRAAEGEERVDGAEAGAGEMEALYLVQRDGSVKVFERGAMA